MSGSAKAAVLPVPVWCCGDDVATSEDQRNRLRWMGVGSV